MQHDFSLTRIRQSLDNLRDSGSLLADGDVDTVQLLALVVSVVEPLLVDDAINGNGGLAKKKGKRSSASSDLD